MGIYEQIRNLLATALFSVRKESKRGEDDGEKRAINDSIFIHSNNVVVGTGLDGKWSVEVFTVVRANVRLHDATEQKKGRSENLR